MYGLPGATDATPIAALLGASAAGCAECYRTQVMAVAANPLLVAHLAGCGYMVLKLRAEQTGVPVPEVAELAKQYVSTAAAMFAALSIDSFTHALFFAQKAEPEKRTKAVEELAELYVDFMKAGR